MYESAYDIVAMGMRYVFLALMVYILLRLVMHSVKEYKSVQAVKQKVRETSPGYLEMVAPLSLAGEKYPLLWENTIGSGKDCTIKIDHKSLAPVHAYIYEKKEGFFISGYGKRNVVLLNGERVQGQEAPLYTQDQIGMGAVILRLHLAHTEGYDA